MITKIHGLGFCSLVAILIFAGCGGSKRPIPTGKLIGNVVDGGSYGDVQVIIHDAVSHFTSGGPVTADGTFSIEEVPDGNYQAWLQDIPPNDDETDMDAPQKKKAVSKIPRKFMDGKTSGLTFVIADGKESTLDIDMSK